MNGYIASGLGSGLASASKELQKGQLQAQDIKYRKELQAQQTQTFNQNTDIKDLQIQQMQAQLKQLTNDNTKKETYSSFDAYRASNGDTKYLNQMLKNPEIRKRLNGVNGMYKVDINSQDDVSLLKKLGLSEEDLKSEGFDPTRYVKVTRDSSNPGAFDVIDLYGAYAKTGYLNTMKKEEIDDLVKKTKQLQNRQQELQVGSAEDWMKANPTKTYQDYLQSSKPKVQDKAPTLGGVEAQDFLDWKKIPGNENKTFSEYENIGKPEGSKRRDSLKQLNIAADRASDPSLPLEEHKKAVEIYQRLLGGQGQIRENKDVIDIVNAQDIGRKLIDGSSKDVTKAMRDKAEAEFINTKKYDTYKKPLLKFNEGYNNYKFTKELNNKLQKAIKSGDYKTGMLDTLKTTIAKYSPKELRELLNMDEKQIATKLSLEGSTGRSVAKVLKEMSGTAASDQEFQRTLNYTLGSNYYDENSQSILMDNTVNDLKTLLQNEGKVLVEAGMVSSVYDKMEEVGLVGKDDTSKPKEPIIGQEIDGYKFLGGNPAEPSSWEEIK